MSDDELLAHANSLDDEQLVEFLAAVDAAEILTNDKPIDLAASALYYATRYRWPVFPLQPRGKKPLTNHGFKDATTDPDTVRAWWTQHPDANIGVPTGPDGIGLDVIDVDGPAGYASLALLKHAHCDSTCSTVTFCPATGELPEVVARAWTPGGPGMHYFTPATGDGNASRYMPGLDYRGAGGYVVVAPSLGLSGKRYSWITRPALPSAA